MALGMALVGVWVTPASGDIFTRRNDRGVLEATDRPAPGEGFKLAYKSKGIVIHSAGFRPSSANALRFEPFVLEAAAREGVSPDLVRAVIRTESAFDHLAVSSAGARGLMQLMPDAAKRFGVQDPFDPRANIMGGVRYLRVLLKMFQGDVALTVAAYNAGEGAVTRHGGIPPYRETQGYVRKILALLSQGPASADGDDGLLHAGRIRRVRRGLPGPGRRPGRGAGQEGGRWPRAGSRASSTSGAASTGSTTSHRPRRPGTSTTSPSA